MKTLYAVTRGNYSDYDIVALFETEERAKLYIACAKEKDLDVNSDITQYPLEPEFDEILYCNIPEYSLTMLKDGTVRSVNSHCPTTRRDYKTIINFFYDRMYGVKQNEKYMHITLQAENKEEAIKIAGEKRAQLLAADLWGKEIKK